MVSLVGNLNAKESYLAEGSECHPAELQEFQPGSD